MKTKYAFLSVVLTVFFALSAFGQYGTDTDSLKAGSKAHGTMMGKPVYESTVQGTHLKVWIMAQADHMKMMDSKSIKDSAGMDRLGTDRLGMDNKTGTDRMGMDNKTGTDRMGTENKTGTDRMGTGTNKSGTGSMGTTMGTGTHQVMVEATDGSSAQPLSHLTGTLQITSPSMKTTSADLQPMMNHYGAAVTLDEKGQYQFTLNLTVDGTSKTAQFQYTPGETNKSMMNR